MLSWLVNNDSNIRPVSMTKSQPDYNNYDYNQVIINTVTCLKFPWWTPSHFLELHFLLEFSKFTKYFRNPESRITCSPQICSSNKTIDICQEPEKSEWFGWLSPMSTLHALIFCQFIHLLDIQKWSRTLRKKSVNRRQANKQTHWKQHQQFYCFQYKTP